MKRKADSFEMNETAGTKRNPRSKRRNVMIAGVFLAVVCFSVFWWGYSLYSAYKRKSDRSTCYALVQLLDTAVRQYKRDIGTCPSGLRGLVENIDHAEHWEGPYITPGLPRDPWGYEFYYAFPGKHGEFDICSLGSDGKEDDDSPPHSKTEVDTGNWMYDWDRDEPENAEY